MRVGMAGVCNPGVDALADLLAAEPFGLPVAAHLLQPVAKARDVVGWQAAVAVRVQFVAEEGRRLGGGDDVCLVSA
jgi:hypothetical protein